MLNRHFLITETKTFWRRPLNNCLFSAILETLEVGLLMRSNEADEIQQLDIKE